MRRIGAHILFIYGLVGCGSDVDTGQNGQTGTGYTPPVDVPESLRMESVFAVPERAWDLAISETGIVYCSAQSGGKLYSWDPVAEDRDEELGIPKAVGLGHAA